VEDSLLKCLEVIEHRQWFIDNALLVLLGALFCAIALFVMLNTPEQPPD
jgi:hypothetical protein